MNRRLRLVTAIALLLALIVGQVHACATVWKLPDGKTCQECPELQASDSNPEAGKSMAVAGALDADCLECCTAEDDCGDEAQHDADLLNVSTHLAFILPSEFDYVVPLLPLEVESVSVHRESFFPNGPPTERPSRAPPAPLK